MKRVTLGSWTLAVVALVLALIGGTTSASDLSSGLGLPQPTLLRLTGFVGGAPQGAATIGTVTLGLDHTVATLDLSEVQTLNGSLTEGRSALRQFDLYSPNILLIGDRVLLRSISEAASHAKISMWGYVVPGARRLLIVDVQPAEQTDTRG